VRKMTFDETYSSIKEERSRTNISVVGCEPLGLTTACLIADAGFKVSCVDSDQSIVNYVKKGELPYDDPELESLLVKNVREGRLSAATDIKEPVSNSSVVLIFVPPRIDQKKRSDYSDIEKVCMDIGLSLRSGSLVILGNGSAPGVTETLVKETLETASGMKAGTGFSLAYYVTRSAAGGGLQDAVDCPKVFGAIDKKSSDLTRAFLSAITKGEIVEVSSIRAAEAVRVFENAYRDANTALSNDLACFCERAGIDFMEVRNAVNLRSPNCLFIPEIVGRNISDGSYLLIEEAENMKTRLQTVMLARKINHAILNQVFYLVKDAMRSCGKTVRRSRILVLGVSCRPNVKESKDSLVKELVDVLLRKEMIVKVYDPLFSYKELSELGYTAERTLAKAVKGMDCLLIAVGHERFSRLGLSKIRILMKKPSAIVDISHVVNPSEAEKEGFIYRGLGRGVWSR